MVRGKDEDLMKENLDQTFIKGSAKPWDGTEIVGS
jgi:hypothetical protein